MDFPLLLERLHSHVFCRNNSWTFLPFPATWLSPPACLNVPVPPTHCQIIFGGTSCTGRVCLVCLFIGLWPLPAPFALTLCQPATLYVCKLPSFTCNYTCEYTFLSSILTKSTKSVYLIFFNPDILMPLAFVMVCQADNTRNTFMSNLNLSEWSTISSLTSQPVCLKITIEIRG